MKTLLMFIKRYDLQGKVQPIVDRYSHLDPHAPLSRKQISQLDGALKRRKRVENREAMMCYILAVLHEMYREIAKQAIIAYKALAPDIDVNAFIKAVNPVYGSTFADDLSADMNYRATQICRSIKQSYYQQQPFDFTDETLKAFLLRATKTQYAGLLDRYMTTVMGYANIMALRRRGFEQVRFRAVMDNRTTGICRYLNGKIFHVDELVIGVNAPPINKGLDGENLPHECRSYLEGITPKG